MTDCTYCGRRAELFLCPACVTDTRDTLTGLTVGPELESGHTGQGWLAALSQAAYGQTRLGESARRSTDNGSPMLCNLKASALLDQVRDMLSTWIRDLCEVRGIDCPALGPNEIPMAAWLCKHVSAIALHPGADEFLDELKQRVVEIERMVNRPQSPRDLGGCPALLTHEYGQRECRTPLSARRDQNEVRCPDCKTVHNVEQLIRQRVDGVRDWLFTETEILAMMDDLGEHIPIRTWRYWRAAGKVQSRNELGAEPKYWLHEVRALLAAKPQKQITGAAAYRQESA